MNFVTKYKCPILVSAFIIYNVLKINLFISYADDKSNELDERKIELALKENKVIAYDINMDGHKDYIFDDGAVFIFNLGRRNKYSYSYFPQHFNILKNKQHLLDEKIDALENNIIHTTNSLNYNLNQRDSLVEKISELDSIYNSIKINNSLTHVPLYKK